MNYIDILVTLGFLANLIVSAAKLYNIGKLGRAYEKIHIFLGTAVSGIAWVIVAINSLTDITRANTYFFMFSSYVLYFNVAITLIEIYISYSSSISDYIKGVKT